MTSPSLRAEFEKWWNNHGENEGQRPETLRDHEKTPALHAFYAGYQAALASIPLAAAVEVEREACAKVCEDLIAWDMDDPGSSAAAAIRGRALKQEQEPKG